MKKNRNIITFFEVLLCMLLYVAIISFTHIGCPIRWLTGVPCPGCGITRSCIAFLRLDFKMAFEYHALTLIIVPSFVYILLGKRPLFKSKKREMTFFAILIAIFLFYYIFRLFFWKNTIISIDICSSFMVKLIKIFKELLM